MSTHDQRSFRDRLIEYAANHAAAAKLNFERAEASGSKDDREWAAFLTDVTIFAESRLKAIRLRELLPD